MYKNWDGVLDADASKDTRCSNRGHKKTFLLSLVLKAIWAGYYWNDSLNIFGGTRLKNTKIDS